MHVKPIRNERDHARAMAELEKLWDAKSGSPEHDRLEVLATLVDVYEAEHHPILPPDPVEAIRFRMEQLGLDRKALEKSIGSRARVSEVLARRRDLSLGMIQRLHRDLGIPAEILIGGRRAAARGRGRQRGARVAATTVRRAG